MRTPSSVVQKRISCFMMDLSWRVPLADQKSGSRREGFGPGWVPQDERERTRRRRRGGELAERPLPPAHVVPASVLEAGRFQHPDGSEPELLVKPDARRIGKRDDRECRDIALKTQTGQERRVEALSNAPAVDLRVDVDGDLGDPLVRFTRAKGARIRVAPEPALSL
jgi:hypothetical protein